jgi:hypothetical protein
LRKPLDSVSPTTPEPKIPTFMGAVSHGSVAPSHRLVERPIKITKVCVYANVEGGPRGWWFRAAVRDTMPR